MSQLLPDNCTHQSHASSSENSEEQTVHIVSLDQTYICFDVEQLRNAKQDLKLKRCAGVRDPIAWRMRTNAPTRYIVNPSKGVIHNDDPVTLTIELVENKFHPKHKLMLQATLLIDGCNEQTIWKHENAKNWDKVQTIQLTLSTMLINIETSKYEEENLAASVENFKILMENSSTTGLERIQELENLLNMLKCDTRQFRKNTGRTIHLKTLLEQALDTRKGSLVELKRRVMECEQKTKKMKKELEDREAELQLARRLQANTFSHPSCQLS
ncbi:unnamed protein product [Thelazia callipaeda]|uniref:Major sperm protein n=1 Tax=Thelazia callipaeda TaxID=103827 RepID=A0A0N5CWY1_THECL|nr:unnamed protein product [Thelazia callipaeda]